MHNIVVGNSIVGDSIFGGYIVGGYAVGDFFFGNTMGSVGEGHGDWRRLDPAVNGNVDIVIVVTSSVGGSDNPVDVGRIVVGCRVMLGTDDAVGW